MSCQHKTLAAGRWHQFTLAEQLAHIGSEISRAIKWRRRDQKLFVGAVERALELFDLTLCDPRWVKKAGRLKEICRAREFLCETVYGTNQYSTSLEDLDRYFFPFALWARAHR